MAPGELAEPITIRFSRIFPRSPAGRNLTRRKIPANRKENLPTRIPRSGSRNGFRWLLGEPCQTALEIFSKFRYFPLSSVVKNSALFPLSSFNPRSGILRGNPPGSGYNGLKTLSLYEMSGNIARGGAAPKSQKSFKNSRFLNFLNEFSIFRGDAAAFRIRKCHRF